MNVEIIAGDPLVSRAAELLGVGGQPVLIAAAPGMGKSSILTSALSQHGLEIARERILWLSGEVVASEAHLQRLLAGGTPGAVSSAFIGQASRPVLAIDDVDEMLSKREGVAAALMNASRQMGARLIGTAHPASIGRLKSSAVFADAEVLHVRALNEDAARILVRRRAPALPDQMVGPIVNWAGGHPAALVYLSRLAEVGSPRDPEAFLDWAAEFAGAVYAEPWTGLGPQQRAVLRQLACAPGGEDAAAVIASALGLPSAHVGAQMSRLVMEGMAHPSGVRGRYGVAPLLARWIARRATRSGLGGTL